MTKEEIEREILRLEKMLLRRKMVANRESPMMLYRYAHGRNSAKPNDAHRSSIQRSVAIQPVRQWRIKW